MHKGSLATCSTYYTVFTLPQIMDAPSTFNADIRGGRIVQIAGDQLNISIHY
jgi:hypothetical protein